MIQSYRQKTYSKGASLLKFGFKVIEKFILPNSNDNSPDAVFIIGPPRSGTTLLYQLMLYHYHFAYFSNFTVKFYRTPIIASWLGKILHKNQNSSYGFTSNYGQTKNRWGPHEAGEFWYQWFPRGEHIYVAPGKTPKLHLKELRQGIIGMNNITGMPVIFKNTYNSMRIAPIMEAIPEACFLVCRRNPLDIAQSILNARIKAQKDKNQWWALPPKEIDQIKAHPYWEQVIEQVYYTYQQIETDKNQFQANRFYDISYESLCKNTHDTMSSVEQFLNGNDIVLTSQNKLIPSHLSFSTGKKVSDKDYYLIVETANKLWREHH